MQQKSVSPAAAAAVITVLVLIIIGIGWKVFAGGKGGSSAASAPPEAQKWIKGSSEGMSQNYRPANGPPGGYSTGGSPGGSGR